VCGGGAPVQPAGRDTKERTPTRIVFLPGFFILKTMMFCDMATVLNERKHFKMVVRSVPDSVSLILGQNE
jgi:hypothetical protein